MDGRKINVLFIEENQDGTTGGSHRCLYDLIRELDRSKINSIVMFYESNYLIDNFRNCAKEVIVYNKPLGKDFVKFFNKKSLLNTIVIYPFLKIVQAFYNTIQTNIIPLVYFIFFIFKNRIDIVHINNSVFAGMEWVIATKITRRKCIAHERGFHLSIPRYANFHYKRYDFVLGMSKAVENNLKSHGVNMSKYSTFYDIIHVDDFRSKLTKSRDEIREEFGIKKDQSLIGIVGNMQRWKGQMTVVESIKMLESAYPQLKCLLIGDVSKVMKEDIIYYNELKQKISHYGLGDKIILTGYRNDIPNILNALDVFIHASIQAEPWGLVVLEAMALGKAIIASNEGGPAEMIISGESGFLIEPDNPRILAEKLKLLLSDQSLRKKFGENAYIRVKSKYSKLDIKYIENLYQEIATM